MAERTYRILRIPVMQVACYLVYNAQEAILVDTGIKGSGEKVLEMLDYLKLAPSALKLIIITHGHYDHAGSAREIKKLTGAPVAIHTKDAYRLSEGYGPLPNGTRWKAKVLVGIARIFLKRLGRIPAMEADILIEDSLDLKQFGFEGEVVHMPGHTPGSLAVILGGGDALVGDTLFGLKNKQIFPPFADHIGQLLESWKKLIELPVESYYPGHGAKISRSELEKEYPDAIIKYR